MFRFQEAALVVFVLALFILGDCNAAENLVPKLHATKVGDTFEIQGGVLAAASPSEIQELAKAVKAGDKEGEQKMLDDGTIEWLPKGSTVRILEIVKPTYAQAFRGERKSPYAECRLIRRGKASGKKYVLLFQFNDSDMKPLKP